MKKLFLLLQRAEKSLLYFKNLKKLSKNAHQQVEEELEHLRVSCKDEDDLTLDDFSQF